MRNLDCVFCKIVNKEIPAETVYEDEDFLAFLSIDPISPGHTLVIPKEHHRWVWDVPKAGEYFEVARKIAKAQQKTFNTEMIRSQIFGEEVPHAHIWVFPHDKSVGGAKNFKTNAELIRKALS
ncbi:MAG: HIT domain-containing protein [bacterium]